MDIEEIKALLDEIDDNGEDLTDWEANFVDKQLKRTDDGVMLSSKEISILQQIRDDRC